MTHGQQSTNSMACLSRVFATKQVEYQQLVTTTKKHLKTTEIYAMKM
jgi:hypothetical protein